MYWIDDIHICPQFTEMSKLHKTESAWENINMQLDGIMKTQSR